MSGVERPTRVNVYNEAALADLLTPGPDDLDATGGSVFDTMTTGRSMQTSTRRTTRGTGNSRHAAAAAAAARRAQVQPSPGHRRRGSVASQSSMVQALVGSVIRHDPNDTPQRARLRQRHVARMERQLAEIQAAVEETKKRKAHRRELRAELNRAKLEAGRGMEETIVTKVTTHLEERAQRRKETYDKWTQDVFDPINDAVTKAVNKRSAREIQRDRCTEYQRYLTATNTRDLFTDIITAEYDPMVLHKHRPKPRVPRLLDPLKRQIHTKMEEDALILSNPEDDDASGTQPAQVEPGNRHPTTRTGGLVRSKSAGTALGGGRSVRAPAMRGSKSAVALSGRGGLRPARQLLRSASSHTAGNMTGRNAGPRPKLPDGPGFGVPPNNLLGRSGGKWTLPVKQWATGKLEANSAACTVKTRMAGGIFDDGPSLEEWRVQSMKTAKKLREKVLPGQFQKPTALQQYNAWSRELPRPQKRTFAPWHHGNLVQSLVAGQTDKDTDHDIKKIG